MIGPKVLNLLGFVFRDRFGFGSILRMLVAGCSRLIHQNSGRDVSF